jgi:ubiquinone/menaquinone biosynthesis C-methylase UbiE
MKTMASDAPGRSVSAFFVKTPERYLRKRFAIQLRAELVAEAVLPLVGARILDAGCGDGSISLQFAGANRLTLLDASPAMLDRARATAEELGAGDVQFVHGTLQDFRADEGFDLVLCIGVLSHLDSVEDALQRLAQLVRPAGRLILQLTDADHWLARLQGVVRRRRAEQSYGYRVSRTTRASVIAAAERAGLRLIAERRYSLLLPGMGRLPDPLLYRLERWTSRRPFIARRGSELLLSFARNAT